MGTRPREQARTFGPFFRSTGARRQAVQGTGLGLAIVQAIVERHGGSIAMISEEGVGTTVCVTLPATPEDSPARGGLAGGAIGHRPTVPATPLSVAPALTQGIATGSGGVWP